MELESERLAGQAAPDGDIALVGTEIEQRVKTAAAEAGVARDRFGLTVARLELSRMLIDLLRRHAQEHGTELNRRVRHKEQTQMLFVDIRDYVMAHCAEDLTPQNMPQPVDPDAQRLLAPAPALELAARTLRGARRADGRSGKL